MQHWIDRSGLAGRPMQTLQRPAPRRRRQRALQASVQRRQLGRRGNPSLNRPVPAVRAQSEGYGIVS